jgi:hypothetical protein
VIPRPVWDEDREARLGVGVGVGATAAGARSVLRSVWFLTSAEVTVPRVEVMARTLGARASGVGFLQASQLS